MTLLEGCALAVTVTYVLDKLHWHVSERVYIVKRRKRKRPKPDAEPR